MNGISNSPCESNRSIMLKIGVQRALLYRILIIIFCRQKIKGGETNSIPLPWQVTCKLNLSEATGGEYHNLELHDITMEVRQSYKQAMARLRLRLGTADYGRNANTSTSEGTPFIAHQVITNFTPECNETKQPTNSQQLPLVPTNPRNRKGSLFVSQTRQHISSSPFQTNQKVSAPNNSIGETNLSQASFTTVIPPGGSDPPGFCSIISSAAPPVASMWSVRFWSSRSENFPVPRGFDTQPALFWSVWGWFDV